LHRREKIFHHKPQTNKQTNKQANTIPFHPIPSHNTTNLPIIPSINLPTLHISLFKSKRLLFCTRAFTGRAIREMRAQLARVPEWLEHFAGLALGMEGSVTPFVGPFLSYIRRLPLGVVAQVCLHVLDTESTNPMIFDMLDFTNGESPTQSLFSFLISIKAKRFMT
jgi:hypothetical protein